MTIKKKYQLLKKVLYYIRTIYIVAGSTFVIWLKLENVSVTVMNGNEADNIFCEKT